MPAAFDRGYDSSYLLDVLQANVYSSHRKQQIYVVLLNEISPLVVFPGRVSNNIILLVELITKH